MRLITSIILILLCNPYLNAQDPIKSQAERLHQYVGHWVSSEHAVPKYRVAEVEDYSYPPLYSVQLAWEYLYALPAKTKR